MKYLIGFGGFVVLAIILWFTGNAGLLIALLVGFAGGYLVRYQQSRGKA
ncbi:hypothetical protein [Candidatus Magnetobacterium casense]|uniref:DUF2273 domain-containing protein n=1 Tax=Candidatus Magnetobacterium casense TaxID=1455061 RepID=A0ABS6RX52_9BACT|nr:hypothetical protein [Candidatus Magnetobacterium casensis]MBV6341210.1 hypothetical protein [Candidatus Magnetobacterium casensis]